MQFGRPKATFILTLAFSLGFVIASIVPSLGNQITARASPQEVNALMPRAYLPFLVNSNSAISPTPSPSATPPAERALRRVNVPDFSSSQIDFASSAIFWFGQVNPLTSY